MNVLCIRLPAEGCLCYVDMGKGQKVGLVVWGSIWMTWVRTASMMLMLVLCLSCDALFFSSFFIVLGYL